MEKYSLHVFPYHEGYNGIAYCNEEVKGNIGYTPFLYGISVTTNISDM